MVFGRVIRCPYQILFGRVMCVPRNRYRSQRRGSVLQSELGAAASRKAVWWDLRLASLLTHLFLFFFCTVTDFSAAGKARGVKFFMHVGLLSIQVFSHFGGQRSRSPGTKKNALSAAKPHPPSVRIVCPRISIGAAVFAGLTSVTDRPTDRPTDRARYSIGNNRPHLRT